MTTTLSCQKGKDSSKTIKKMQHSTLHKLRKQRKGEKPNRKDALTHLTKVTETILKFTEQFRQQRVI